MWETFEPRIEVWTSALMEMGVDLAARQTQFALAQHSREGYELANNIVVKLLKMIADRRWPDNPSGFVHRCATNARKRVMPKEWKEW